MFNSSSIVALAGNSKPHAGAAISGACVGRQLAGIFSESFLHLHRASPAWDKQEESFHLVFWGLLARPADRGAGFFVPVKNNLMGKC